MIHIATVHWQTDRWIAVQDAYLRRHLQSPFRVYAWLNDVPNTQAHSFHYACTEPVAPHAVKLNLLADIITASASSDDDWLIFIDGDAFPVGDLETLGRQHLETRKLIAVQRLENNGDIQPHPCFCLTTVGFWRSIKGDWNEGYRWKNWRGQEVTDVGGNLLKQLSDCGAPWLPLLRSNRVNLHPLFFGVYGGVLYHHGAGFRSGESRIDTQRELSPRDRVLAKFVPGHGRRARRKLLRQKVEENNLLIERVFNQIRDDPDFYQQFI